MSHWRPASIWQALGGAVVVAGCIAYTLLAHYAASVRDPGLFEACVFIVPLMAVALAVAWRSSSRAWWLLGWAAAAVALWTVRDRLGAGTQWVLLLQHVGINAALCLGFGRTLGRDSIPLISRLAQMLHGELSPRLVRYTRGATLAWTLFFAITALLSVLLFALAPAAVWSGYVNLLSVPLLAAMFAGEYIARVLLIPREERSGFFEALALYRRFSRNRNARPH
ncbi:MAG: hypothetical protein ABI919_00175 [Ramlibacter sp.]